MKDNQHALVGFGGFGGPEIALHEAGIKTTSIEFDADIAEVSRINGNNVIVTDILTINPTNYINWWLYHFSPPCPSFSVARSKKNKQSLCQRFSDLAKFQQLLNGESEIDLQLSQKIVQFIRVGKPEFFTLENVWAYRKSLSFMNIYYALIEEGYGVDWWHLNAADYGVPQSRKRMILIARRDGRKPAKPWPTHSKTGDMFTKPWVGWYEAIEDLIPDLPETRFADWQLKAMPKKLKTALIGHNSNISLVDCKMPAFTITTASSRARAFLSGNQTGHKPLSPDTPSCTVMASESRRPSSMPKAFIVGGHYQTPKNGKPRTVQNRPEDSPVWTIVASENGDTRVCCQGRVVSMAPRCLARFQDFPDWFQLPDDRTLACKGIGNALPVGMYRAALKSLM